MKSRKDMKQIEVSPRDYHTRLKLDRADIFSEDSWLSKSALWELKSSSLYRWRFAPKVVKPSDAINWGTLIDCLITTPDELEEVLAIHTYDSFRTKEAREFKQEALDAGLIPITEEKLGVARGAAEKIMANRAAAKIIESSKKQVVLLSELRGIKFKGLVDLAPENELYLADLKTTADLSKIGIEKRIADLGYHVQAAIYLKLWNNLYPDDPRKEFRHIWQSSTEPYEVAVTDLHIAEISAGEEYSAYLLGKLIKAAKKDKWPNIFNDKIAIIGRPQYAMYQEEAEMDEQLEVTE